MTEQPTPKPVHELWSAISPTDLGLKAGYWTGNDEDPLTFRPIVGWISVVANEVPASGPPRNRFHAVVLADNMFPTPAELIQPYCGVFPKHMSEQQAKEAADWMKPERNATPQPNVTGIGHA